MIFNPDTNRFFCPVCQFGVHIDKKDKPYAENIIVSADGHRSDNPKENAALRLKIRPVRAVLEDSKRRNRGRADPLDGDPDLKRIRDSGSGATIVKIEDHVDSVGVIDGYS